MTGAARSVEINGRQDSARAGWELERLAREISGVAVDRTIMNTLESEGDSPVMENAAQLSLAAAQTRAHLLVAGIRLGVERDLGHTVNIDKWLDAPGGPADATAILLEEATDVFRAADTLCVLITGSVLRLRENVVIISLAGGDSVSVEFGPRRAIFRETSGGVEREVAEFAGVQFVGPALLWWVASAHLGDQWLQLQSAGVEPLEVRTGHEGVGFLVMDPKPLGGQFLAAAKVGTRSDADVLATACSRSVETLLATIGAELDRRDEGPPSADAETRSVLSQTSGCLLGGAIGDALGYAVEFDSLPDIRERVGDAGVRDFLSTYERRSGLISDDTQMTLFTADALVRAGDDLRTPSLVRGRMAEAYLDWYVTQTGAASTLPRESGSSLLDEPWLHARRAPGLTIMSALDALHRSAATGLLADAANDSKGCGTVMRSAPFGLVPSWGPEEVYGSAAAAAALTHGHSTGQVAAGMVAVLVRFLVAGGELRSSIEAALAVIAPHEPHRMYETTSAVRRAITLADSGEPDSACVELLGGGWVAEEALAIAVYCALVFPRRDQILDALSLAVTHPGDSDSTGAVCGNILGALHGESALPLALATTVEGAPTILRIAAELAGV